MQKDISKREESKLWQKSNLLGKILILYAIQGKYCIYITYMSQDIIQYTVHTVYVKWT